MWIFLKAATVTKCRAPGQVTFSSLQANVLPVLSGTDSAVLLLLLKSVDACVPQSLAGSPKTIGWLWAVTPDSCVHSSLMGGRCFSMNRLISTISCADKNRQKTVSAWQNRWSDPPPVHTLTSGHETWDRPRYDLKVRFEGLTRPFIFSAVCMPNMNGTMGSASPWHCSTWMSLLALLAEAWE